MSYSATILIQPGKEIWKQREINS